MDMMGKEVLTVNALTQHLREIVSPAGGVSLPPLGRQEQPGRIVQANIARIIKEAEISAGELDRLLSNPGEVTLPRLGELQSAFKQISDCVDEKGAGLDSPPVFRGMDWMSQGAIHIDPKTSLMVAACDYVYRHQALLGFVAAFDSDTGEMKWRNNNYHDLGIPFTMPDGTSCIWLQSILKGWQPYSIQDGKRLARPRNLKRDDFIVNVKRSSRGTCEFLLRVMRRVPCDKIDLFDAEGLIRPRASYSQVPKKICIQLSPEAKG